MDFPPQKYKTITNPRHRGQRTEHSAHTSQTTTNKHRPQVSPSMTNKKRAPPPSSPSLDDEPLSSRRRVSSPSSDLSSDDGDGHANGGAGAGAVVSATATKPTFNKVTKGTDYKTKAPQMEMAVAYDLGTLASNDHLIKITAIIKFGFKSYTLFADLNAAARAKLHRIAHDLVNMAEVKRKMEVDDQDFVESFEQYAGTASFQLKVDTRHCAIYDRDKQPMTKENAMSMLEQETHFAIALLPCRVICGEETVRVEWSAIQLKPADAPLPQINAASIPCLLDL